MPARLSVKHTVKPKYRTPKYSVKKSSQYHVFKASDGTLKIRHKEVRSLNV